MRFLVNNCPHPPRSALHIVLAMFIRPSNTFNNGPTCGKRYRLVVISDCFPRFPNAMICPCHIIIGLAGTNDYTDPVVFHHVVHSFSNIRIFFNFTPSSAKAVLEMCGCLAEIKQFYLHPDIVPRFKIVFNKGNQIFQFFNGYAWLASRNEYLLCSSRC